MTDHELDRLIARANPYGDETVANLPAAGADAELLEEIVSTPTTSVRLLEHTTPRPPRRWRRRPALLAAAAVAAIVAVGGVVLPGGGGGPVASAPAYAASVIAVAEANPRLLLDEPGWSVSYVAEFTAAQGEMRISNGHRYLELNWRPAGQYRLYLDDRSHEMTATPIMLLGQTGSMFSYNAEDFTTILPPRGQNFLEIRGTFLSETEYRRLIAKLYPVDVNTWLDALPESVVRPEQKAAVITEILADIPVPKGFDARKLNTDTTTERYHVGARVTGAVTCAWVDQWAKAKKSGDAAGVQEAVDAMRSARSWKILREMDAQGDYPEVVWEFADAVVNGTLVIGKSSNPKAMSTEDTKPALGC